MKKYLFIFACMFLPLSVNAQTANIDITSSKTNANVNDNITVSANVNSSTAIGYYEYTLDYNHSVLRLTSGNPYNVEKSNNNTSKSFKKEFKFKVIGSGTSKITAKSYVITNSKNDNLDVKVNPVTINASGSNRSSSSNNYLSSLEVEGYRINPSFNKNTTNYELKIEDDISEINVKAKAEDENATITGDGKQTIKDGQNKIEIVVISENGEEKTYNISVNLNKTETIQVKIDDKNYTIIKSLNDIDVPSSYKLDKIKINNEDVEVFYSDVTKLTLVALKDEQGNVSLYVYNADNNTYSPYNVINIDKLSFLPVKTDKKFKNYSLYTETINNIDLDCYKLSSSSDFCIIYGINLKTGEEDWYTYSLKENTIQKYNYELEKHYDEKLKNTRVLIYILSATTLLFGITTIVFAVKSNKKR